MPTWLTTIATSWHVICHAKLWDEDQRIQVEGNHKATPYQRVYADAPKDLLEVIDVST
jgi:hypothetical protein